MSDRRTAQKALYKLLQDAQKKGQSVSLDSILKVTGWKESSFGSYYSKGQLSFLIKDNNPGMYIVNIGNHTETSFLRKITQDKTFGELGGRFKSQLARLLLQKSKDNMYLALELYNRPSLVNKIDSFVVLFCMAWELILKSFIIEKYNEDAIFYDLKHEKSLSLRDCIKKVFKVGDPVADNILDICELRDQAVHLLIPEFNPTLSRIFQSGVINYKDFFFDYADEPLLSNTNAGLMSLIGSFEDDCTSRIIPLYGQKIGRSMLDLIDKFHKNIEKYNEDKDSEHYMKYAVPIEIRLVFAKKGDDDFEVIAEAGEGIEGVRKFVVEKYKDPSLVFTNTQSDMVEKIHSKLAGEYDAQKIFDIFGDMKTNGKIINSNCFEAVISKLGWKKSNNEFHRLMKAGKSESHCYSDKAVREFIKKVMENPDYYKNAKKEFNKR